MKLINQSRPVSVSLQEWGRVMKDSLYERAQITELGPFLTTRLVRNKIHFAKSILGIVVL